jgi:hypothetical protein
MKLTRSTLRTPIKPIALLTSCLILAACGGGGGGGDAATSGGGTTSTQSDYVQFANATSGQDTRLSLVGINVANAVTAVSAGRLNHNSGTVDGGLLDGVMNDNRTRITFGNSASATLVDPGNTAYARVFSTSGLPNDLFGVVGQVTNGADIPAEGASTYNGTVELQADNGTSTFALTGDALIKVEWDPTGNVDTVFSNLDGTRNDTVGVQNVGTVTINDAIMNGARFSGGTFSTTGAELAYAGGGTQVNEGQLFGPDATEVGGVFGLDAATLELTGVFIAKGDLD